VIYQTQNYLFSESYTEEVSLNNQYTYNFSSFDVSLGELEKVNLYIDFGIDASTTMSATSESGFGEAHWYNQYDSLLNSIGTEVIDAPLGSQTPYGDCYFNNEFDCEIINEYEVFSVLGDNFGFRWADIPIDSFINLASIEVLMSSIITTELVERNDGAPYPQTKYGDESGIDAKIQGQVDFFGTLALEYHYKESNAPTTNVAEPTSLGILVLSLLGLVAVQRQRKINR